MEEITKSNGEVYPASKMTAEIEKVHAGHSPVSKLLIKAGTFVPAL